MLKKAKKADVLSAFLECDIGTEILSHFNKMIETTLKTLQCDKK